MQVGYTIAAISSATGSAGRMILRLSGNSAWTIACGHAADLPEAPAAFHTHLDFSNLRIPAWVYLFRGPRSYTGEDLIEFHIPGNPLLARMLLDALLAGGARQAEAGEFTARAYFNGRMDLSAAEGVAAIIAASGDAELRAARQLLDGELSRRLRPILDELAEILALVEVGIDFSEEDVTFLPPAELRARVGRLDAALTALLAGSARFERLAHEPSFVLVGRPNAGKSTLVNVLARRARAVVSPVAGTTRDVLSAEVALKRGIVRLLDVAGLEEGSEHQDAPSIDSEMRKRALDAVTSADFVVLIQDSGDPRPALQLPRGADVVVASKCDVPRTTPPGAIAVSAHTGEGIAALIDRLEQLAFGSQRTAELSLNARHLAALDDARAALTRAADASILTPELPAFELREALNAVGSILGEVSPDDLLGRVFAAFCIGK